jgi:hypothetical protein
VSLVARLLEENGIATVILGCCLDIVEYCGVPRFLFTDFPLGNPCGKPWDHAMQRDIVGRALDLAETATRGRTTVRTPFIWSRDEAWKDNYMRVDDSNRDLLRSMGEERRVLQQSKRAAGKAGTEQSD